MPHARTTILEALQEILRACPTTEGRVYLNRPAPLDGAEVPGLVVVMPSEAIQVSSADTAVKLDRLAAADVVGYARGSDIEQRLNQIALEVEERIFADQTLGVGVKAIALDRLEVDVDAAAQRAGAVTLGFQILYRTAEGSPGTIIA